jgi:hydroxypyruvate reductase
MVSNNLFVYQASHPVTDERGVNATAKAIELAKRAQGGDVVLCLISGGASALFAHPLIPLSDWQQLTNQLLASGCTINELNAVRKQLDEVKGGGLLKLAAPATCISLILSDVVGNPLDVIGSGPTVPNPDDPATALRVLRRYNMQDKLATDLWIKVSDKLEEIEGSKPGAYPPSYNYVIGDVQLAAEAAQKTATELGFHSVLLTSHLEGEAREVGRVVAALAKDMQPSDCMILGGETTVTLKGNGLGGRNQELALSAALAIDGWEKLVLASFATDGDDGPTDAAGAIVTGLTITRAESQGLDPVAYLDSNDSYHFFNQTGGLIITGQTGTNVNDLIFLLKYQ